jgi:hypothetical protein
MKVGSDKSDRPFIIEVVRLTYPKGGKPPFSSGQDITITWTTYKTMNPVYQVRLLYTLDNGVTWKAFTSQTDLGSDPGSHTVQFPMVRGIKSEFKVKVVLKDGSGNKVDSDTNDGVFTMSP